MTKKMWLKIKKNKKRKAREYKLYRKRHFKETIDYAIDCFIKDCYT
ncbi:hypothetical protein [Clostridium sporogenes]|nr:hypothetical protein [Clostridium sporogenes]KRU40020.1 hypothetical protein VT94_24970 [Clostridium sporogenes]MBY7065164.1 hypothetical protein [Clostridium sporogenes]MBY7071790.1 hypothetical protein [Clostridium sporogenes]MCW6064766.1 hypothetical protein [Clostridium sporogenes]OQP88582.1 hypothetical protein VT93_0202260 [Clostridium sporogenes]